jgi:hypothetical protein
MVKDRLIVQFSRQSDPKLRKALCHASLSSKWLKFCRMLHMCARTLAVLTFAALITFSTDCLGGDDAAASSAAGHVTVGDVAVPEFSVGEMSLLATTDDVAVPEFPVGEMSLLAPTDLVTTDDAKKATSQPLPAPSEIVTVKWNSASTGGKGFRKSIGAALPFDRLNCTVIAWVPQAENFDMTEFGELETPPNTSLVSDTTDTAADITAETADVPAAVLAELHALEPVTRVVPVQVQTHESYVADLMSLLPAQSAWMGMKSGVVDLAPGESRPAYLDELHALSASFSQQREPIAKGVNYRSPRDESTLQGRGVYRIPRPAPCDPAGAKPSSELFRPLSDIDVNSASTSPPQRPNAVDYPETLLLPDNLACDYFEVVAPGYYFTPTRYGVARPNRNTYAFCNNPLYFEDPNLERCGRSYGCLTSLHSATQFAARLAVLPYMATAEPQCCLVRALPDCPTCHEFDKHDVYPEWQWSAAGVEAGVITSLFYIVP